MKKLTSMFLGAALFAALCSTARAEVRTGPDDGLRRAYESQCRPAARAQLKGKAGSRVVDRLCECAADRAEAAGWVLPEFPHRDAEECLAWAQGFLADSPFARLPLSTPSSRVTVLSVRRLPR